jgi:hypothetical protein
MGMPVSLAGWVPTRTAAERFAVSCDAQIKNRAGNGWASVRDRLRNRQFSRSARMLIDIFCPGLRCAALGLSDLSSLSLFIPASLIFIPSAVKERFIDTGNCNKAYEKDHKHQCSVHYVNSFCPVSDDNIGVI